MEITKTLDLQIDVANYMNIIQTDGLQKIFQQRFRGRCFGEMYILEIVRIVRRSNYIISVENSTQASIRALVEAKGIYVSRGEVLMCKLESVSKGICRFSARDVNISVEHNSTTDAFSPGQSVPIEIRCARYPPFETKIIAVGSVYIPSIEPLLFCVPPREGETGEEIKNIFSEFERERVKFAEEKLEGVSIFAKMLSIVQTRQTGTEYTATKSGGRYIFYDPADGYDSPIVRVSEKPPRGIPITATEKSSLEILLQNYIFRIGVLRSFASTFNTLEKINGNKSLWKIYARKKTLLSKESDAVK